MKKVTMAEDDHEDVGPAEKDDDSPAQKTPETAGSKSTPTKLTSMADSLSGSDDSYQLQGSVMEDDSSDDDTTDHDDDDIHNKDDSDDQVEKMALMHTSRVLRLRFVVYGAIVFVGIILCVATFGVLKRLALEGKRAEYYSFTKSLNASAAALMVQQKTAMAELARAVTLSGDDNNATARSWPFVTVSLWESRATAVHTAGLDAVLWTPLVPTEEQDAWIKYADENVNEWLVESRTIYAATHGLQLESLQENGVGFIYNVDANTGQQMSAAASGPFAPIWQVSPPPNETSFVNHNLFGHQFVQNAGLAVGGIRESVFTSTISNEFLQQVFLNGVDADADAVVNHMNDPRSLLLQPVFEQLNDPESDIVGMIFAALPWYVYFDTVDMPGAVVVLQNTCGEQHTYLTDENGNAAYFGKGDWHNSDYDSTQVVIPIEAYNVTENHADGHCQYSFVVYASEVVFEVDSPLLVNFTVGIACGIMAIMILFRWLDLTSMQGSDKVISAALNTNSILTSLFPKIVRDRMIAEKQLELQNNKKPAHASNSIMAEMAQGAASVHADDEGSEFGDGLIHREKPIADLFPATTIMFADIAGFTAWSSVREPTQVFQLLETLYHAFDKIAKRRRVFKVETIGDCYVAVTGLPQPRADHAVACCRFARECLMVMNEKVRLLEQLLGPDTADLKLRVGLHSGQVTAGVLRGERARFQLFGDTMNTASRMESTGSPGKIQISQETADQLTAAGKMKWFTAREDKIVAKGKGEMQTYWIVGTGNHDCTVSFSGDSSYASKSEASLPNAIVFDEKEQLQAEMAEKQARLVNWVVEVMLRLLKAIVAQRLALRKAGKLVETDTREEELVKEGTVPLDEVVEIIQLPQEYVPEAVAEQANVHLEPAVIDQLHDYVSNVASIYHSVPFHGLEHATHVTMSVTKLLSRIVAPHSVMNVDDDEQAPEHDELHDHTFGITSDPLTQFSVVLSAFIHDADHVGVPNTQLVKEGHMIAEYYKECSVAEQNSIDICWGLLMQPEYVDLCRTIFCNQTELRRFRQLLVNAVMATDIMDKDLKVLRNKRWEKAFSADTVDDDRKDTVNRKATIVIEHLIQASDVAHTMQHWHIYRKWNERFFLECHKAYKEGRAAGDPASFWYTGELGFYDFYIIPLAKKLKDCGVFGVASDEYLNYAVRNRKEWEERGQEIVCEMVEIANLQEWSK